MRAWEQCYKPLSLLAASLEANEEKGPVKVEIKENNKYEYGVCSMHICFPVCLC